MICMLMEENRVRKEWKDSKDDDFQYKSSSEGWRRVAQSGRLVPSILVLPSLNNLANIGTRYLSLGRRDEATLVPGTSFLSNPKMIKKNIRSLICHADQGTSLISVPLWNKVEAIRLETAIKRALPSSRRTVLRSLHGNERSIHNRNLMDGLTLFHTNGWR